MRFSELPPPLSLAVIDWPRAVTEPPAELGVPPAPPALPTPTTPWPTVAEAWAIGAVCSPLAPTSWMTATSPVRS